MKPEDEVDVLIDVLDRFGEHLEMVSAEDYPVYLTHILSKLLLREIEQKEFYKGLAYGKQPAAKHT